MKKNFRIGSLLMGLALLLAIVLQSADAAHHLEKELTEKKCFHQLGQNKAEITHAHHGDDHCFTCEFTFSQVMQTRSFSFELQKSEPVGAYTFFHSKEITQFFKGSLFALRAPPVFIV